MIERNRSEDEIFDRGATTKSEVGLLGKGQKHRWQPLLPASPKPPASPSPPAELSVPWPRAAFKGEQAGQTLTLPPILFSLTQFSNIATIIIFLNIVFILVIFSHVSRDGELDWRTGEHLSKS